MKKLTIEELEMVMGGDLTARLAYWEELRKKYGGERTIDVFMKCTPEEIKHLAEL